jgi:hypothetical protein
LLQDIDKELAAALATEECLHVRHAARPSVAALATEAKPGQFAASNELREQLKSRLLNRMKDSSSQQGEAKRGQPAAATERKT